MVCSSALRRGRFFVWILFVYLSVCTGTARAAATAELSGTVELGGKAAAGATVVATGNNITQRTQTDGKGVFVFSSLAVGSYTITASLGDQSASFSVDLSSSGTRLALELRPKVIGNVSVARAAPLRGSGTDIGLSGNMLKKTPGSGSLPGLLLQVPGAARGANGVVHINGDHGDINYVIDGAVIPQELNRAIGTEFDANNVGYAEILQGAYPAQYGERFASVVNINTLNGAGAPGGTFSASGGSFTNFDSSLTYHTPIGSGFLVSALRNARSDRSLDPPDFDSPHANGSNTNQFLRYYVPTSKRDYLNLTVSHSYQTFQIPNYVSGGEPATTDDNETQDDLIASLQARRAIGSRGAFTLGATYKNSVIRDLPDAPNDYLFGIRANLLNGGAITDCANAFILGTISQCGFSVLDRRTSKNYTFNSDYAITSGKHSLRAGAAYDTTLVPKVYQISLQPANYLAPIYSPSRPDAPYTVVDNAPNVGHTETAYLQDSWRMSEAWQVDYGLRLTAFQIFSTQFDNGFSQFSPRLKVTRYLGERANVYAYYGRLFTPFSFENVSPQAGFLLNSPLQTAVAPFDLKPQRDSVYEFGGHVLVGRGEIGARIMQKNATDLIDDTQVGFTNLHQDINYALGRIATQSISYSHPLVRQGRAYLSFTHTYSVNKGCETQLLAPCFGASTDWTPADHDQRYDVSGGMQTNDAHGGWLSWNGEYGSGLSSTGCMPQNGNCKYTPHTIFSVQKGLPVGRGTVATFGIDNVLNDRFLVTYFNAQGDHYVAGRTYTAGLQFSFK